MQPEDILRLREDQSFIKQQQTEDKQRQLISQLKQTIKTRSTIATEQFNDVLQQAIDLIKKS